MPEDAVFAKVRKPSCNDPDRDPVDKGELNELPLRVRTHTPQTVPGLPFMIPKTCRAPAP
jgi:hypothetical protein